MVFLQQANPKEPTKIRITSNTTLYEGDSLSQYTDSNGIQHIDGASGLRESFNLSIGILTHDDGRGHVEQDYMR